jgi:hypothetical protein
VIAPEGWTPPTAAQRPSEPTASQQAAPNKARFKPAPDPLPPAAPIDDAYSSSESPEAPPIDGAWSSPTEQLVRKWLFVAVGAGALAIIGVCAAAYFALQKDDANTALVDEQTPAAVQDETTDPPPGDSPGNAPENATDESDDQPTEPPTAPPEPDDLPDEDDDTSDGDSLPFDPSIGDPEEVDPPSDAVPPGDLPSSDSPPPIPIPSVDAPHSDGPHSDGDAATDDPGEPSDEPAEPDTPERPELPDVDVEARLEDRIAKLDFRETPLWRCLDLISQISSIPISLDGRSLAARGVALDEPVTLTISDATAGEAIARTIERWGLSTSIDSGQLIVAPAVSAPEELDERRVAVGDLSGASAERLTEIADLIPRAVAPKSWTGAGGGSIQIESNRLAIEQTPEVHKAIDAFLARWRAAQSGAKDPSPGYVARRAAARSALDQPVKLNFAVATPLEDVVDRLRRETTLVVLIDWRSLSENRVGRATLARMPAGGISLARSLRLLLEPLDATALLIDDRTLEIVSRQSAAERLETEFYAAANLVADGSAETLVAAPNFAYLDASAGIWIVSATQAEHDRLAEKIEQDRLKRVGASNE